MCELLVEYRKHISVYILCTHVHNVCIYIIYLCVCVSCRYNSIIDSQLRQLCSPASAALRRSRSAPASWRLARVILIVFGMWSKKHRGQYYENIWRLIWQTSLQVLAASLETVNWVHQKAQRSPACRSRTPSRYGARGFDLGSHGLRFLKSL